MKFTLGLFILTLLAALCFATAPQKQYIISYPQDTPVSVLEDAKDAIVKAGGVIEHEYNLIKGYVVRMSANTLDKVQAMGSSNNVLIEEDKTINVAKS
ncbi:hypothetical protein BAUCODRAFT_147958 [Baudoinia panamericana UAMH 10762]|uniref:Inhibitor I9 domain-containing protein n=1 Tax=Baudoinia panamericana (strain UAMH 10762) TaxID=717646 RepID=M2NBP4_BAUPA|nr:uncharacterized protein BAUCODRAFT_147958 [Baudoinia panamericana UAMH 10762]EMC96330.1 hypothetical protein BAUCODRAFT_147958 [Baudoinia panamericana UAMH 10762]